MAKPIKPPVVSEWQLIPTADSGSYKSYVWSGSTTKKSVELVAPADADLFSVTALSTTNNFSVVCRIDQLSQDVDGTTLYSTYKGSAKNNDKLKISDAGVMGDSLFTNISSVEVLALQGSGDYDVTLAAKAEAAGIVDVIGGFGNDRLDASGYAALGIELDGGAGSDTLIGGAGSDTLIGGLGADVINLESGGSDVVVFSSVLDGSAAGSEAGTFSGFDTVTGFEAGVDQLDLRFAYAAMLEASADSLSSVDTVVGAMNAALDPAATYAEGAVVLFKLTSGADQGLYAGTIADADLTDAAFTPAFMAAGVTCLGVFMGPPPVVPLPVVDPVVVESTDPGAVAPFPPASTEEPTLG